jgi:serine/threonine-protein kinase
MQKIGAYQVVESLYAGPRPLFKVKAADGRILALKTAPVASLSPEMRERFNREAQQCSTLDHPNVIRVLDWGEADGQLYQAMDLLEGADLARIFNSGRQFAWEHKLSIMEQVCDGLQYAHDRGLVHRDIKPSNIFIEYVGRVRVLDFGMARVDASTLTQAGSAVGTLNYMAPEQLRGEKCTRASDIFSAGIVFYQLAGGRHPFSARQSNVAMIMNAIMFEAPPPLAESAPDAPDGLELILSKALVKDPARRLQSAADLKQALALCRVTLKMRANAPPAPTPPESWRPIEATVAMRVPTTPPPVPHPPLASGPSPASVPPVTPAPPGPSTRPPAPPGPSTRQPGPQTRNPSSRPSTRPPDAAYCASCTTANPIGASFCQRCGQPLSGPRPPVAPAPRPGMGGTWALALLVSGGVMLIVLAALIWLSR